MFVYQYCLGVPHPHDIPQAMTAAAATDKCHKLASRYVEGDVVDRKSDGFPRVRIARGERPIAQEKARKWLCYVALEVSNGINLQTSNGDACSTLWSVG